MEKKTFPQTVCRFKRNILDYLILILFLYFKHNFRLFTLKSLANSKENFPFENN